MFLSVTCLFQFLLIQQLSNKPCSLSSSSVSKAFPAQLLRHSLQKYITNNLSQSSVLILAYASKDPSPTWDRHTLSLSPSIDSRASTYFHWFFQLPSSSYTALPLVRFKSSWQAPCACFLYTRSNTDHLKCEHTVFSVWVPTSSSSSRLWQIHHIGYRHSLFHCCSTY